MGMPPMNLLPGRIAAAGFEGAGVRIPIAAPAGPALLGLRPEHLSDRPFAGACGRLALRVSVIEPLGDRQDVTLATPDGTSIVARIDSRAELREGEESPFYVDLSRLHLFDERTGARLESASELVRLA
jgi:multiple sugar transport system ATP-binding protein